MALTLRSLFSAVMVLSLAACGGSAGPKDTVGSTGQQIIGGTVANGYPEAVLIQWPEADGSEGVCTGSLIAPRLALTAGHCVSESAGWSVQAPYAGNQQANTNAGYTDDYNTQSTQINPAQHDVALLVLSTPINVNTYASVAQTPVGNGTLITDVGRDDGATISLTDIYQAQTTISKATFGGFSFDYQSQDLIEPGDSGGPVYLPNTHTVVAVNSGSSNSIQMLARVDLVKDWIALFRRNPDRANCFVQGAILAEYNAIGGVNSFLGDCTTNELPLPDGVGRASQFEQGSIYWTPATGAHEVHGAIRAKWEAMGWETSPLGYPITDEFSIPGGRQNNFQRGNISWVQATGAVTVTMNP